MLGRLGIRARWPAYAAGGLIALPVVAWGAFAWSYGAATPCGAELVAFEAYLRRELTRAAAEMDRRPGQDEVEVLERFMDEARERIDGMSERECWDDLRASPWAARV